MSNLKRLIDLLLAMEEINGGERCPTYLYRWRLFSAFGYKVYLHHFVGDDWSRDMHDHPRRFVSIGLWGRYVEETPKPYCNGSPMNGLRGIESREYRAPWARSFPAKYIHRIRMVPGFECWTLVIVCRITRAWGFWHKSQWIPWREYVNSDVATEMKACD